MSTPQELLAGLETSRAVRLDPLDYPGQWTEREKLAYTAETERLDQQIVNVRWAVTEVMNALSTISHLDDRSVNLDVWEGFLVPARKQLCDELLALPKYVRERSEREHQQNLEISIDTIDRGLHILPGAIAYSLKGTKLGDAMEASGLIDPNNENLRQFSFLRWGGSLKDINAERTRLTTEKVKAEDAYRQARAYLDRLIDAPEHVST